MSGESRPPHVALWAALISGWRTLRTMYYANSVSWRALKSGALLFMGLALWSGANLLLSYQPGWRWLYLLMAYGFVTIFWGPFHHLVIIPVFVRLRRAGEGSRRLVRQLPNIGLVVFGLLVVAFAVAAPGAMTVDFQATLSPDDPADVNPSLRCTKSTEAGETVVHCHLERAAGVDRVVVQSGGEQLLSDDSAPFAFDVRATDLSAVVGDKQFQVVCYDEDGNEVRRFTRRLDLIPGD